MADFLKISAVLLLIAVPFSANAKDFGILGDVFPIAEKDPIELIKERLSKLEKSGKLKQLQKQWQQDSIARSKRPKAALTTIKKADKNNIRYFDPSITLTRNLFDHKGVIFGFAGQKVNPFDYFGNYFFKLIFIDGDNQPQVEFALNNSTNSSKIILVRGDIIALMQKHKTRFFFDQQGLLVNKFSLDRFPVIISREGKILKIEEIAL